MLPLLREGRDIIEIRTLSNRIKKYDVVLYRRGNNYVLHRCLGQLPNGKYIFAGDNNLFREYDVSDDMILGVMVSVTRHRKKIKVSDWQYIVYYHIWCDLYPIPVYILHFMLKIKRMIHSIIRSK